MKFTIDRTVLAGVIPPVKSCFSFKGNKCSTEAPVLLSASGELLRVAFYDEAGRSVCHSIPASVAEEGLAAFGPSNLNKLLGWLKKLGRSCRSVTIEGIAGEAFDVKAIEGFKDDAKCIRLTSAVPDEFCAPIILHPATPELAEVPVELVKDIASRARASSNPIDSNPTDLYAKNLCVSFSQEGTKIVWTDGCLLLCGDYPEGVSLESGRVVVPLHAVISLLKYADPSENTVVFGKSSIRCGRRIISFPEFEHKYPDLSVVLQPEGDTEISSTAEAFREALKRVSSRLGNDIVIRSKINRGVNLLTACIEKNRRFEDSPRAEVWFDGAVSAPGEQDGYASAYCVNIVYLKAVLADMTGQMTIRSSDSYSPLHISFENSAIRGVLMPKAADYLYKSV